MNGLFVKYHEIFEKHVVVLYCKYKESMNRGVDSMITVLFVCLGNICRSPMAEAVFRELVRKEGLENRISADSAGLGGWHVGEPPHRGTQKILQKYNISSEGLAARKLTVDDLGQFDYIIAMDDDNISGINGLRKENRPAFIGKLLDFVKDAKEINVPDPYYTGNFEYVYELVTDGCVSLLKKIKDENGL